MIATRQFSTRVRHNIGHNLSALAQYSLRARPTVDSPFVDQNPLPGQYGKNLGVFPSKTSFLTFARSNFDECYLSCWITDSSSPSTYSTACKPQ